MRLKILQKKSFSEIFFGTQISWAKFCFDQNIFLTNNFVGIINFWGGKNLRTQNFLDKNFFWTQNYFGPKFFWPKIFLDLNIFGPKIFWTQYFLDPKIFFYLKCFWTNIFCINIFFWPTFFLTNKFLDSEYSPKFLDQKLFAKILFFFNLFYSTFWSLFFLD